jgi:hypothetical protein
MNRVISEGLAEERRFGSDLSFCEFDYENETIRSKLTAIARFREPTLEDLERVLIECHRLERERVSRETAFHMSCHEQRDDLKVFYVYNTADRKLTILAKDVACARHFAFYAGHIHDPKNGRVMVMKPENEAKLRKSGAALGRALRDGKPGVVTELGDNIVMEASKRVYTPITVVSDPPSGG